MSNDENVITPEVSPAPVAPAETVEPTAPQETPEPEPTQDVAPEAPVAPAENAPVLPVAPPADEIPRAALTTFIRLEHNIMVNGRVFPAGENVEVPADQAEDLRRIDAENTSYELSLVRKADKTAKVSAITLSAAGQ